MNLVIQKRPNGLQYVSIRESYWDPVRKKYSSRTIENFGRLDLLEKENPNILDDLKRRLESYKTARAEEKQNELKQRVDSALQCSPSGADRYADNPVINIGGCVLRQIWNKLRLQRKLRDLQATAGVAFNLPAAAFFLTATRALLPDSKLGQWTQRKRFLCGARDLALNHVYHALDVLVEYRDDLIRYLNKQIESCCGRAVSAVFYDVTTYYFESQDADTLRKFGFSKDNKVNQVQVVMGLLIDENGIPLDYELYPGNTSEFSTMVPVLKKLKQEHGIDKVVIVADRGLNSGANLLEIKKLGMDYVIAFRLRSAGKKIEELIRDQNGWIAWNGSGTAGTAKAAGAEEAGNNNSGINLCDISRYRLSEETRTVRYKDADGTTVSQRITSNLLITYSPRRARKDAADRQRLVNKAQRLAEHPGLIQSEMKRGGKSYLKMDGKIEAASVDMEKIEKAALYDGYYGIVYSASDMTAQEVASVHHGLWQIEESFRITKSQLEARPCYHWKEKRIRGHFLVCYLALVIHRLLEHELEKQNIHLTADEITDALQNAMLQEISVGSGESVYCKSGTEGHFEKIAKAVGLSKLPRIAKPAEVKVALKLKSL